MIHRVASSVDMAPNQNDQTLQNVEFSLEQEMCRLLGLDFTSDIKETCDQETFHKVIKQEEKEYDPKVDEEKCDAANAAFLGKVIKQEEMEHKPKVDEGFVEFEDNYDIKNETTVNGWNGWDDESLKWDETPMQALKAKLESLPDPEPFSDVKIVSKKNFQFRLINGRIPCDQCPKTFRTENTFKKHIKVVHVGLTNKPKCSTCGKRFQSHYHLKRHQQSVHEGLRFHCNLCTKHFSDNRYLRNHVRAEHESEM